MADLTRVDFAVEWNSAAVVPGIVCGFEALPAAWKVAEAMINAARSFQHTERFVRGNADAWATDYEHPERAATGDSLNNIDNTHLMYFSGHGARELSVSLASDHFGCRAALHQHVAAVAALARAGPVQRRNGGPRRQHQRDPHLVRADGSGTALCRGPTPPDVGRRIDLHADCAERSPEGADRPAVADAVGNYT
jgi:hypothetical protein